MTSEYTTGDDIFTCTQCGDCCTGFGGTYVTEADIQRICDFIDSDPERFRREFLDTSGSRFVIRQSVTGACIFFKELCTIHPVKPFMCRAWPFIRTLETHPENWEAMAGSCPGMKRGIRPETVSAIVRLEQMRLKAETNAHPG